MGYSPRNMTLKDGRQAVLRLPRIEDSAEMAAYLDATSRETEFIARSPGERIPTVQEEEAYLTKLLADPHRLMIVCQVGEEVAGNCQIVFHHTPKTAHRGTVMIALLQRFWGLGIGSAMFDEMIRVAREKGLRQLELQVIDGNERGVALYQKKGFQVVGRIPGAYRLSDGFHDELQMVLKLN